MPWMKIGNWNKCCHGIMTKYIFTVVFFYIDLTVRKYIVVNTCDVAFKHLYPVQEHGVYKNTFTKSTLLLLLQPENETRISTLHRPLH